MVLGGAVTAGQPMPRAQQAAGIRRVGVLSAWAEPENNALFMKTNGATFRQELERLGWQLGRNLYINYGWVGVDERVRTTAADLLAWAPEVDLSSHVGCYYPQGMSR